VGAILGPERVGHCTACNINASHLRASTFWMLTKKL
jgi:hypothetical protein